MTKPLLLDCTLRDGGYYNHWDFSAELINDYLDAMAALEVDYVELGLRSLRNEGFKGGCAFTTDRFIGTLRVPDDLNIGVMVNAAELVGGAPGEMEAKLEHLFAPTDQSPVGLVRIACHVHEFEPALAAASWLKVRGYLVGFNLMQVADRRDDEIRNLSLMASRYPLDVLYFADSMGSMSPEDTRRMVGVFREHWHGPMGIHTHDNMGNALANTLAAYEAGVTWLDATVTGMGRGPGNTQTECLVLALASIRPATANITPLLSLIRNYFDPLKQVHQWGTNPYYYMAGKYGIHPTYVQEMLSDNRYSEEDILAAIEHLKVEGGKRFSLTNLESARHFYRGALRGTWSPANLMQGRDVLVLGSGPGIGRHREMLEQFIAEHNPCVIALNAQKGIAEDLIDVRAACHPVRLLADCEAHLALPQPLVTPYSMLPEDVQSSLDGKDTLDFGLTVSEDGFEFLQRSARLPSSLVVAYVLAIITSGRASRIMMAGFDGYPADDPRNEEMEELLARYLEHPGRLPVQAITPTRYHLPVVSIYGLVN